MKKVTVDITIKALIYINDDASLSEVLDEMDYNITDTTTLATVIDTEMTNYDVIDSR